MRINNLWLIPEFTGEDMVSALWRKALGYGEGDLIIVSLYLDINSPEVVLAALGRLLHQVEARQQEVIIYTDTNTHSSLWNSNGTNGRGEVLEEFILLHNLVVLNNGNHFTFFNRRSATIIDMTLASCHPGYGREDQGVESYERGAGVRPPAHHSPTHDK